MSTNPKIKNCSVRISSIAKPYGFKTLRSFQKFLKQCEPNAKLYFGASHIRVSQALGYVERELQLLT
tara:strand:- start:301 stop:501 length:201 start_codon:yes stop_codon:yes gene_type:complete